MIDTNILVAELTRGDGRMLITHPTLQIVISDFAWEEVLHEVPKRLDILVARGRFSRHVANVIAAESMTVARERIRVIPLPIYASYEAEARVRIAARDPRDWPTVAVALTTNTDIWTRDKHFLGCGVATWDTDTLAAYLAFRERTGS